MFDFKARVRKLQEKMPADCTVIAGIGKFDANAYYYSGTEEPLLLYALRDKTVAFTDAEGDFGQFDEVMRWKRAKNFYKRFFRKNKVGSVGLDFSSEANRVGFRLLGSKSNSKVKVTDCHKELDSLRDLKDEKEKQLISKAQEITMDCVEEAREKGFEGKTENEIAGLLEYSCRKKGFALDSFPPIVASGAKSAIPHATPSRDAVKDFLLVDCGATCGNYHADYSQTFAWGKGAGKEFRDAVEAVREAKKAAEKKARVGVSGKIASKTAEKVIAEYGFGRHSFKKIGLSLGHSVGLRVHDGFRLEEVALKRGMAFTIEPGIYIPKRFGVRFEDVVFL